VLLTHVSGVISKINTELAGNTQGRLFAQIHVCGKQFKVTPEDLIVLEGQWAPDAGERIKLEKVCLLAFSSVKVVTKHIASGDAGRW
jgi:large subunit ribosomal protein L21